MFLGTCLDTERSPCSSVIGRGGYGGILPYTKRDIACSLLLAPARAIVDYRTIAAISLFYCLLFLPLFVVTDRATKVELYHKIRSPAPAPVPRRIGWFCALSTTRIERAGLSDFLLLDLRQAGFVDGPVIREYVHRDEKAWVYKW